MNSQTADVAVIGAGIVGLAFAHAHGHAELKLLRRVFDGVRLPIADQPDVVAL